MVPHLPLPQRPPPPREQPNGRLLASVDKPPRAAEDALVDEPSIFSVDGQPYATFHPPDSATSYGKLVRGEGSSNGLKIEGRKTLKRLYGTLGVAAGVLVIAVGGIGMAVGVPGLMYACIYVALFVFVFGLCAGNCSPSSYGVFSLDGSVSYPRVYAKPSHTKCAMSSQADDGNKYITFAPTFGRRCDSLEGRLRFDMLLPSPSTRASCCP